jgi:hypothetical protein
MTPAHCAGNDAAAPPMTALRADECGAARLIGCKATIIATTGHVIHHPR